MMKICAIVAEYNPFHTGHAYQAAQARASSGADFVVAVMDGNFTQRGETAAFEKRQRARLALQNGIDAVVELPTLFAVRSAQGFAAAGVEIASALGADALSFGCETDDTAFLNAWKDMDGANEPEEVKQAIRLGLDEGKTLARARGEALAAFFRVPAERMNQPNAILAVEYMRANQMLEKPMEIHPVRRTESYHSADIAGDGYASAGAIRRAFLSGNEADAWTKLPDGAREMLKEACSGMDAVDSAVLYHLRGMSASDMDALPGTGEGMANRMAKLCRIASGREDLIARIKCKRYTYAAISRAIAHALLGITEQVMRENVRVPYIRILGFRRDAGDMIREIKRRARLSVVTDAAEIAQSACFQVEERATDLFALTRKEASGRRAGREWTEKFVVVS